jgi:hypothetical protein
MPDPLFQTLIDDTDSTSWQEVDVVRERARRRTLRTRVAGGIAGLVAGGIVLGGAAVAQLDRAVDPQPGVSSSAAESPSVSPASSAPASGSPSAPPSASESAAAGSSSAAEGGAIGNALFLRPGDVGSGYQILSPEHQGDWTFEFTTAALRCPYPDTTFSDLQRSYRMLRRGTPESEDFVSQYVARYRPGDAARYLDQVRARVEACTPADGGSLTVSAERFAGQDALLIEVNYGEGNTTKLVLVRQGDLLTEFFTKPERSGAAAQELGRKAAQRLCAGTPVC